MLFRSDAPNAGYELLDVNGITRLDMEQFPNGVYLLPGRYVLRRTVRGVPTERTFDVTAGEHVERFDGGT